MAAPCAWQGHIIYILDFWEFHHPSMLMEDDCPSGQCFGMPAIIITIPCKSPKPDMNFMQAVTIHRRGITTCLLSPLSHGHCLSFSGLPWIIRYTGSSYLTGVFLWPVSISSLTHTLWWIFIHHKLIKLGPMWQMLSSLMASLTQGSSNFPQPP